MKFLKDFALFEGGSSYRSSVALPKSQAEAAVINNYPEMKNLLQVCSKFRGWKHVWGYNYNSRSGTIEFDSPLRYDFKFTKSGSIYYGGIVIGPSTNFVFNDWHSLTDFVTVYVISKAQGFKVSSLDKFVFDGTQIPSSTFKKIMESPFKDDVIALANKYNPGVVAELLSKKEKEVAEYIVDTEKILETPTYAFFSDIFGIQFQIDNSKQCLKWNFETITPYGIFDDLLEDAYNGSWWLRPSSGKICLGPEYEKIKTFRGLDGLVRRLMTEVILEDRHYLERSIEDQGLFFTIKTMTDTLLSGEIRSDDQDALIIDTLEKLKLKKPISFSSVIESVKNTGRFPNVVKHFEKDEELVKGASLLRKFNIFDDTEPEL